MDYMQITNNVEDDTEVEDVQTIDNNTLTKGLNELRLKFNRLHSGKNGKRNESRKYSIERKTEKRGNLGTWAKRYETKLNHADITDQLEDTPKRLASLDRMVTDLIEDKEDRPSHVDLKQISQVYEISTHDAAYVLGATGGNVQHAKLICFSAYFSESDLKKLADLYRERGYDGFLEEMQNTYSDQSIENEEIKDLNIRLKPLPRHVITDEANITYTTDDDGPFNGEYDLNEIGMRIVKAEDLFDEARKEQEIEDEKLSKLLSKTISI